MASAAATVELQVDPDTVWQLIGGFGALPDWLPYIVVSDLGEGGRLRRLSNPTGEKILNASSASMTTHEAIRDVRRRTG